MTQSQGWMKRFRWLTIMVVGSFLLAAVFEGLDRDLPGVVRSLGVVAFYLGLLSATLGTGRAPRIGVLQVLLLTVATGAFLWVWSHAHKVPNLILVVAGLLGLGVFVWLWGRRRD